MIRANWRFEISPDRAPRVSGDDPPCIADLERFNPCSPRERG